MGVFAVLDGISPWWWLAAAILLAALEMVTVSTVFIWSALAALVTGLWLWASPGLPGTWQVASFAVLSIVFTFGGRAVVGRFGDGAGTTNLNRRAEQIVGREAVVLSFDRGEGQVSVDGVPWPARLDGPPRDLAPGDRVRVAAADGIVVIVRPV